MENKKITKEDFKCVRNDYYGNPRFVCSFFKFIKNSECGLSLDEQISLSTDRARELGGKKYRGKDFGGGFVFCSYNIQDLCDDINKKIHK